MSIQADNQRLCLKVIDRIKEDIQKGVYCENEQLPSEFELSKMLGVTRTALREALKVLEDENVIIRRHGVGTFVNPKPLFLSGIEQLNSVTKMIEQASMTPGTIFMSSQVTDPTEDDLLRFQNADESGIFLLERVRTANGVPVVYCLDKIPMSILPDGFSHEQESMFEWLENKSGAVISYAVADIVPIGFHDTISQILECDPETALLLLKQIHYDQHDKPVLYSLNYFRADKFRFHVVRKRF
ncbi:GntR family transcriptional regulator [Bacillus glycinifermentans]|uniref:GntR family transcriptional regulator n=1 Tax=Bacillus glycinifermentans TaxID=1664069 RepID=UPI001FF0FF07|nr:GntR family transcriptional regulator [Bacillus glycinifermentans]MEC3607159.1 GntR family transcriptional regulator [Bacillus glycinifermentans]UOY89081.1 GntR family transcriptional regulator [Bacillus glycinifermentans]